MRRIIYDQTLSWPFHVCASMSRRISKDIFSSVMGYDLLLVDSVPFAVFPTLSRDASTSVQNKTHFFLHFVV